MKHDITSQKDFPFFGQHSSLTSGIFFFSFYLQIHSLLVTMLRVASSQGATWQTKTLKYVEEIQELSLALSLVFI